jgi:adenosylhomocysteinase
VDQEIALEEAGAEDLASVRIVAEGHGVNYTIGPGNPIEVMDLSFGAQLQAVRHLVAGGLVSGVHRLPEALDREVAAIALAARGLAIDTPTGADDWRLTRFGAAS